LEPESTTARAECGLTRCPAELDTDQRLASLNSDITSALASSGPIRESLTRCTDAVARRLGVLVARIWTLDKSANML